MSRMVTCAVCWLIMTFQMGNTSFGSLAAICARQGGGGQELQSTVDAILESTLSSELGVPVKVGLASSMLDRHGLTRCEEEQFQQFESTARAESWLTGRAALKRVLSKCARDQDTSGILFPNREVSLSHSGDIAIAVFTDVANMGGIGVDVKLTRTVRLAAA